MALIDLVDIHNMKKDTAVNETSMSQIRKNEDGTCTFVVNKFNEDGSIFTEDSATVSEQQVTDEISRIQKQVDDITAFKSEYFSS